MLALKAGDTVPNLKPWGAPEDMGGATLDGEVRIEGLSLLGHGHSRQSAGWYSASQGKFRLIYPFQEHATLVEGSLTLTHELTGESVRFAPGDSRIIPKGAPVVWEVHSPRAVKHYMISFDDI